MRIALWTTGARGVVVLFPGRTEMIEKYSRVVRDLASRNFSVAVIDWRGQGLSERLEDKPLLGDVADFALFQQDVAAMQAVIDTFLGDLPWFVLAHSMGGCIALRALLEGFPARAAAFSAPMWGLPVTPGLRRVIAATAPLLARKRIGLREIPGAGVEFRLWENPFDNNELTSDRASYDWMQWQVLKQPALQLGAPSLRWLAAALAETNALLAMPAPAMPAYCGLGTRESIVSPDAIRTRMADWPAGTLEEFDGALHELLMEGPAIRTAFLNACCRLFDRHAD